MNRPPSVMRLMGAQWLAHTLYPDLYPIDIREEVAAFMKLFFNYELKADDLKRLFLNNRHASEIKNHTGYLFIVILIPALFFLCLCALTMGSTQFPH